MEPKIQKILLIKRSPRDFSHFNSTKILALCIFFFLLCVVAKAAQNQNLDKKLNEEIFEKEIDILYSELLDIEESIGKSLRKIQLLQRIQRNKALHPSISGDTKDTQLHQNSEEQNIHQASHDNYNVGNLFAENSINEELAFTNSFVEKNIFEVKNTTFVKYEYLDTPYFIDSQKDETTKVLVALLENGILGIFSLNSGTLMNQYNISEIRENNSEVFLPHNWLNEVEGFITDLYGSHMTVTISDFKGNVLIIDLTLQSVRLELIINYRFKFL